MSRFEKKRGKTTPAISTASLPDIIFILLFFFMVVTVMREVELKVRNRLPKATELTKLEKKSLVSYIYIGQPIPKYQGQMGTAPRIQLNDQFADVDDVPSFVESERAKMQEALKSKLIMALRVDKEVKMGIVTDVKEKLRDVNALKINYSALPDQERMQ